jgi:hypothetical protein
MMNIFEQLIVFSFDLVDFTVIFESWRESKW